MRKYVLLFFAIYFVLSLPIFAKGKADCNKIKDSNIKKICRLWHSGRPMCGPIFNADWKKYCQANITYLSSLGFTWRDNPKKVRAAQIKRCEEIKKEGLRLYCVNQVKLIRNKNEDPCMAITNSDWRELCKSHTYVSSHPKKGDCRIENRDLLYFCTALSH